MVGAAGAHLLDTVLRHGDQRGPMPPPELPKVPGRDVAGVIDAVGAGVEEWLGRRVVAHMGMAPGWYAEQAVTARGGSEFGRRRRSSPSRRYGTRSPTARSSCMGRSAARPVAPGAIAGLD